MSAEKTRKFQDVQRTHRERLTLVRRAQVESDAASVRHQHMIASRVESQEPLDGLSIRHVYIVDFLDFFQLSCRCARSVEAKCTVAASRRETFEDVKAECIDIALRPPRIASRELKDVHLFLISAMAEREGLRKRRKH